MSRAELLITAVVVEGRSKSEIAREYGVSRYWVQTRVKRFETEGVAAYQPRSRRPHSSPHAVTAELEDQIIRLRKELSKQGLDAGAETIAAHLARDRSAERSDVPAVSTIWRILSRREFVTPQPQKRPRSSWKHFCAEQPNERWFADYYNNQRPHRALQRKTPAQAYAARPRAVATGQKIPAHYRVRNDVIDRGGSVTLRHNSKMHHIGLGTRRAGTKVTVLVDDLHVRVVARDTGEPIRDFILDPSRDYQPRGLPPGPPKKKP